MRRSEAMARQKLGQVALREGKIEEARERLEELLALNRDLGDREEIGITLRLLGEAAEAGGEASVARAYYVESLTVFRSMEHKWGIAWGLTRMGCLAAMDGEAERASRLFGAAAALREAMGAPVPPVERPEIERAVAAARAALGETAFAIALREGARMPMDEAIESALGMDDRRTPNSLASNGVPTTDRATASAGNGTSGDARE